MTRETPFSFEYSSKHHLPVAADYGTKHIFTLNEQLKQYTFDMSYYISHNILHTWIINNNLQNVIDERKNTFIKLCESIHFPSVSPITLHTYQYDLEKYIAETNAGNYPLFSIFRNSIILLRHLLLINDEHNQCINQYFQQCYNTECAEVYKIVSNIGMKVCSNESLTVIKHYIKHHNKQIRKRMKAFDQQMKQIMSTIRLNENNEQINFLIESIGLNNDEYNDVNNISNNDVNTITRDINNTDESMICNNNVHNNENNVINMNEHNTHDIFKSRKISVDESDSVKYSEYDVGSIDDKYEIAASSLPTKLRNNEYIE